MGHRKFRRLAHVLGSPIVARGALEMLWDHAYLHGDDYLGTSEEIEELVGWTGERGRLANALADAGGAGRLGFIEPIDDTGSVPGAGVGADAGVADRQQPIDDAGRVHQAGATTATRYRIHDLSDHAPITVRRKLDRRRTPIESPIASAYDTDATPDSSRSTPLSLFTTDEEEGTTKERVRVPAAAPPRADAVVLTFPVVGRGPSDWPLMQSQLEEWQQAFPGLDLEAEARKALVWVKANTGRRKTASGMTRFLVGWLTREVNARARQAPASPNGRLREDGLTHRSHEVLKGLGRVR